MFDILKKNHCVYASTCTFLKSHLLLFFSFKSVKLQDQLQQELQQDKQQPQQHQQLQEPNRVDADVELKSPQELWEGLQSIQ